VNVYKHRFTSQCPNNREIIVYDLEIQYPENKKVMVEDIAAATAEYRLSYHEDISDKLFEKLGGKQILRAHHHGVDIITYRGFAAEPVGYISAVHLRLLEQGSTVVTHVNPSVGDVPLYK
jgi:hypothetical protein